MNKLNPNDLNGFSGTTRYYQLSSFKYMVFTDGIHYLAETYHMWWLINDIAIFLSLALKKHPDCFYCVILRQIKEHVADLIITDGNDLVIHKHRYDYVDFVFEGTDNQGKKITEMKLFIAQNDENCYCLMLTGEY